MSISKDMKGPLLALGALATAAAAYTLYSYANASSANNSYDFIEFVDPSKDEQKTLYKKEAIKRSRDISNVSYALAYALLRGGDNYHGQVNIQFTLREGADLSDVFVDYRGEKVLRLEVNGSTVTEKGVFRDHRVYFPQDLLKEGVNNVTIRFVSKYVRDCQGVHYFVD